MKISTLLDVICAAHLSSYVQSPAVDRGGIMLVAPPSSLKSTLLNVLEQFSDALVVSDINVRQLNTLRDDVANNVYRTLAFPEFEKLYMRRLDVALNIEGHVKEMMSSGFSNPAYQDQRMVVRKARCVVIAAITPIVYQSRYQAWRNDGFARRFLWCHYVMKDKNLLMNAIHEWKALEIAKPSFPQVKNGKIDFAVGPEESERIRRWLRYHIDPQIPFLLMKRCLSVLKMKYKREPRRPMAVLKDFSASLGSEGTELVHG